MLLELSPQKQYNCIDMVRSRQEELIAMVIQHKSGMKPVAPV